MIFDMNGYMKTICIYIWTIKPINVINIDYISGYDDEYSYHFNECYEWLHDNYIWTMKLGMAGYHINNWYHSLRISIFKKSLKMNGSSEQ